MDKLTLSRWTAALLVIAACAIFVPAARADIADPDSAPAVDPFRALIQEPVVAIPPTDSTPKPPRPPPQPPILQPVNFTVTAVAADGATRVAVVEFEGQTYIVQDGSPVPSTGTPAFTVQKVSEERVIVMDTRRGLPVTKQLAGN